MFNRHSVDAAEFECRCSFHGLPLHTAPSSLTQLWGQPTAALPGTGAHNETCNFFLDSLQGGFPGKVEPAAAGWRSREPVLGPVISSTLWITLLRERRPATGSSPANRILASLCPTRLQGFCFQVWSMALMQGAGPHDCLISYLQASPLAPLELCCALNDVISGSSQLSSLKWEQHLAAHEISASGAEILLTKVQLGIWMIVAQFHAAAMYPCECENQYFSRQWRGLGGWWDQKTWAQVKFKYLPEYKPATISRLTLHTAGHHFPFSTDFCNFSCAVRTGINITIYIRLSLKRNYFEFLYLHFGKSNGEVKVQDTKYSLPFPG